MATEFLSDFLWGQRLYFSLSKVANSSYLIGESYFLADKERYELVIINKPID